MKDATYADNFATIAHEISHVFGVNSFSFGANIVQDGGFNYLASPNVKQAVIDHFGCPEA
jgi:hypothetical protein